MKNSQALQKIIFLFFVLNTYSTNAIEQSYDFEEASGFMTGPLEGSNDWSAYTASTNSTLVSNENPKLGTQHFRLINDPAIFAGFPLGISSPILVDLPVDHVSNVKLDVYISNINGASYDVVGNEKSTNSITWTVRFAADGKILVWDDIDQGFDFQDTNILWPQSMYFNLSVNVNPIDSVIHYTIDGVEIYASDSLVDGLLVDSISMSSDNSQLENEYADFDNININNIDVIYLNGFE